MSAALTASEAGDALWQPGGDHLATGLHRMDRQAIQQNFVEDFPASRTRRKLAKGFDALRRQLSSAGLTAEQWVGGSFTSGEPHPEDIDLINIIDWETIRTARKSSCHNVDVTIETCNAKLATARECGCDARLILRFEPDNPNYPDYLKMLAFWHRRFGRDWLEEPRGFVVTQLEPGQGTDNAAA